MKVVLLNVLKINKILLILFIISTHNLNAQVIGIKGSFNYGKLSGLSSVDNYTSIATFSNIGFQSFGRFFMNDNAAFQFEFGFNPQGAAFDNKTDRIELKVDYFHIPLLFQYHFNSQGNGAFFFETGPQLGFLMSQTVREGGKPDLTIDNYFKNKNIDATTKTFDATWAIGAGIGSGKDSDGSIEIGFRYYFGLSNVFEGNTTKYNSVKNSVVMLYCGLSLGVK